MHLPIDRSEWVSEWLLFNAKWVIFQLYHSENKLQFNFIRLFLLQANSVLLREVASLDENNLVAFYCLSPSEIWPYKRGDLSLRDNLVAVEIWSGKRDGL